MCALPCCILKLQCLCARPTICVHVCVFAAQIHCKVTDLAQGRMQFTSQICKYNNATTATTTAVRLHCKNVYSHIQTCNAHTHNANKCKVIAKIAMYIKAMWFDCINMPPLLHHPPATLAAALAQRKVNVLCPLTWRCECKKWLFVKKYFLFIILFFLHWDTSMLLCR